MGSRFVGCVLLALLGSAFEAHADPIRLRVGTLAVDGSRYTQDILALGKEIESRTRRAVRIDWITGGQLGDEQQMATKIRDGTLDGGGLSETGLIALVPEMAAWQYAGLFRDYADVDRATIALDPTVRELFASRKLTFAMWADLGFAHVFSVDPITSLRDVLKIAAPHLTVPLDGNLTASIVAGRAPAWALPPLYMMVIGPTKARSMTSLRYRYVVGGLVFGDAAWKKLSRAKQQIVLEVCREWEPKLRASWRRETEAGIAALTKAGVRTRVSSPAEVSAFFDAAARARGAHAKGPTAELVAKIVASLAR
jgi:TRAP-type transport system periplasmic protein